MKEARYQELLSRVLDDELRPEQAAELKDALVTEPDRLGDLQFHLVLWELFSQERRPERRAEAFLAGCRTRLAAETHATPFVERTMERLALSRAAERLNEPEPGNGRSAPGLSVREAGASAGRPSKRASGVRHVLAHISGLLEALRALAPRRRSFALPLIACVAFVAGVGIWFFGPTMGEPALVQGAGLSIVRAGQALPAIAGMRLQTADVLGTPTNVTAIIGFAPEATRVTLQPGTELTLVGMSGGKRFALRAGKMDASVSRQRPFRPMVVATPQAKARVVGTRFTLAVTNNATHLEVTEGEIRFTRTSDETKVKVGAGCYAVATANYELAALPFTGSILREWWNGVGGKIIEDLLENPHFRDQPNGSDMARTLELAAVKTNRVAVRFRGYLHPPASGNYEFWLAGATDAVLLMSPNENPAHHLRIAYSGDSVGVREWDHPRAVGQGMTQWSSLIPLVAGKRYYLEALVFIEKGEGHLSVAWKRPGASRELLTGDYLSPFKPK